jgi:hypothetical protein
MGVAFQLLSAAPPQFFKRDAPSRIQANARKESPMKRLYAPCFFATLFAFVLALVSPALRAQDQSGSAPAGTAGQTAASPKTASNPNPKAASGPAASSAIPRATGNTANAGAASTGNSGPVKANNYRSKTGGQSAGTGPVNNSSAHGQPDEAVSRRYQTRRDSPERKSAKQEKPTP